MIFNTTEQDSAEAVTEYKEKPSWAQTMKASMLNFTSVSLSTSASNYYYEERDKTVKEWIQADPNNTNVYKSVGSITKQNLAKLENMYEEGKIDAIKNFNGQQTRRIHIKENQATEGTSFLAFKKLQQSHGWRDPSEINDEAEFKAYNDYQESGKIVEESEFLSAKLVGTMGGALQDPVTLMTLPLGSWKTGASILGTAGRAFLEEAAIETAAQGLIIPQTYAYKKELGINTTIQAEAYNAVISIGTAGLIRGTGSAVFDLTSKGIKSLKVKDPELGAEYELLAKSNISEDMSSHIDELHRTEFGEQGSTQTTKPNEVGAELNKQESIPEYENISKIETNTAEPLEDLQVVIGKDIDGNLQTVSYKEVVQELNDNDIMFTKIEDCILRGVA